MTPNRTIIEIHALETTAAGNLNRDDNGSPKTVDYGGVTRARVSSQAWKKPTRDRFRTLLDQRQLGVRTKRIVEVLCGYIVEHRPELDEATAVTLAEGVLEFGAGIKLAAPRKKKAKGDEPVEDDRLKESKYLLFMGRPQYEQLADVALELLDGIEAADSKEFVSAVKTAALQDKKRIKQIVKNDRAVDVLMFGRMVADDTDLNVDASVQVAHAISVQAVDVESDYFTAVDDVKQNNDEEGDAGAAMVGQIEFNAATFYRYANVDVDRLNEGIGDAAATAKAVAAFVQAFVTSMPQGKINTFAHATLPELVVVNVRDTQAVNLVGAFERPVEPNYVQHATEALVAREQDLEHAYDIIPVHTWVVRVGEDTKAADVLVESTSSLRETVEGIERIVAERLTQE